MKKPPFYLVSKVALAAALVTTIAPLRAAGTFTWNGVTSGSWTFAGNATAPTNWVGNATLTSDNQTDLIFNITTKTLATSGAGSFIGGNRTVRSLSYGSGITANIATSFNFFNNFASDFTMSANTGNASITVEAGATGSISLGAASGVGNGPWGALVLGSNLDVNHNGSGQLTFNRAVTGPSGLTKTGTGNLAFTGNSTYANTYTGITTVSGGGLILNKSAGVDAIAGNVLVNGTGNLTLSLAGNQIKDSSNLEVGTGGTFAMVGNSTVNASETVNGVKLTGGSITSSGNSSTTLTSTTAFDLQSGSSAARLSGTAGAIKSTIGTVVLSNGHTISGNITVNEGTLQLTGFNSLTGATLNVNGGALYASASGPAGQDIDSASSLNLNGGTLRINPSFASGNVKNYNALPVVVSATSTLSYENGASYSITLGFGSNATSSPSFVLNSGLTVQNNSSNTTTTNGMNFTRNLTGTGSLTVNTYSDISSSSSSYNNGRVLISGNNTGWSGDLVVAKGTSVLGGTVAASSGGSASIVLGETSNPFGAGLVLSASVTGAQTIARNIIVRSGGFRSIKGSSDNSYTLTGNVTLEGDLNVDLSLYYLDKAISFSGEVSGPGGLYVSRTNNTPGSQSGDFVRLSGNNTFTGPTTVSSGQLELRNNSTSSVTVNSGAGLRFTLNDGSTPIATTTGNLTLSGNTTVSVYGTPAPATTYTLLSAASVSGSTPSVVFLTANVTGFSLVVEANALKLKPDVVADATAPAAPSVNLLAASDTGSSGTDGITNATTLTLRVTLAGAGDTAPVVGDVVKLYRGATQVAYSTLVADDLTAGHVDLTTGLLEPGNLSFTATVTDASSNTSHASGALAVTLDTTPPLITVSGTAVSVNWGSTYTDAGASASDLVDGVVAVVTVNPVISSTPGTYTVTYNATDAAGNPAAQATRNVTVSIANASTAGADGITPLMKYALGAASPEEPVQAPVTSATPTELSITAVVRTNDANLIITAETNTDLTQVAPASGWTVADVTETLAAVQGTLPDGCVRKVFSVNTTGAPKKFLRLKAVSTF